MALIPEIFNARVAKEYSDIAPFVEHDYGRPRYYQSPARLLDGRFIVGDIQGNPVIFKSMSIMGTPVLYGILPPVPRYDNDSQVQEIIKRCGVWGLYFLTNEEQIMGTNKDGNNAEYLYENATLADRYGPNKKQYSRPCNKFIKLGWEMATDAPVWILTDILTEWGKWRGKSPKANIRVLHNMFRLKSYTILTARDEEGVCHGFHASCKVGGGVVFDMCAINPNPINDLTAVFLQRAANLWKPEDGLINRGAAVRGKASKIAKEKRRPCEVMQLYRTPVGVKMTQEIKDSFLSGPENEWL